MAEADAVQLARAGDQVVLRGVGRRVRAGGANGLGALGELEGRGGRWMLIPLIPWDVVSVPLHIAAEAGQKVGLPGVIASVGFKIGGPQVL